LAVFFLRGLGIEDIDRAWRGTDDTLRNRIMLDMLGSTGVRTLKDKDFLSLVYLDLSTEFSQPLARNRCLFEGSFRGVY
jgi:hypothetical protein